MLDMTLNILQQFNENKLADFLLTENILKSKVTMELINYLNSFPKSRFQINIKSLIEFIANNINADIMERYILIFLRHASALNTTKIIENYDNYFDILIKYKYISPINYLYMINRLKNQIQYDNFNNNDLVGLLIYTLGNTYDNIFNHVYKEVCKRNINEIKINKIIDPIRSVFPYLNYSRFVMRKLKKLNNIICIKSIFFKIIPHINDINIINKCFKFYYDENLAKNIDKRNLYDTFVGLNIIFSNHKLSIERIFNYLSSDYERDIFTASQLSTYNETGYIIQHNININSIKGLDNNKIYSMTTSIITDKYLRATSNNINTIIKLFQEVSRGTTENLYIIELYLYTRFCNIDNIKNSLITSSLLNINRCLHLLRCFAKRYKKTRLHNHIKRNEGIIKEIKTFKPNKNIKVLSKGSRNYQVNSTKFNIIPPRHILYNETYDSYYLTDKPDGILYTGVMPINLSNIKYMISAEYIEDIDIYLVFDIDIPDMRFIDRYNYLRSIHPKTRNTMMRTINSLEEFIEEYIKEKKLIKEYIEENEYETKWYPKFYTHCDVFLNFNDIINENIKLDQNIYPNDGLILKPQYIRDLKIKPKSQMTIDLYTKNGKWYDRENNTWGHIINDNNRFNDCIVRCYPVNNMFEPMEIRYDKKKPNPFNVIKMINYLLNGKSGSPYYDDRLLTNNKDIINIIEQQKNNIENIISKINPIYKKKWLDLGCGNGKIIKIINKYHPYRYMGIDLDERQIIKAIKYHDKEPNIYSFIIEDLNEKIELCDEYDYIIINFSIQYFPDIIDRLKSYMADKCIIIYNTVINQNKEWRQNNSYMIVNNDKVKYKFEWCHDKEHHETIPNIKHNYNQEEIIMNNNELASMYKWFIVRT